MFNATIPTRQVVICMPSMTLVDVAVVASRSSLTGTNGTTQLLPWAVQSYDKASMTVLRSSKLTGEQYAYLGICVLHGGCGQTASTIRPTKFETNNVFELLVAYAEKTWGTAESLLDIAKFEEAIKHIITNYLATLLNGFRKNAALQNNASDITTRTGAMQYLSPRAYQSRNVTIVLEVLLVTVVFCLLGIIGTRRTKVYLQDKPGSAAAHLMLLAGSRTVRRLREEGPEAQNSRIWDEIFGLGWWPVSEGNVRWGIDFGTLDAELQEEQEQAQRAERASNGEQKPKWWQRSFTSLRSMPPRQTAGQEPNAFSKVAVRSMQP